MTPRLVSDAAREARFEAVFAEVYEPLQRYLRRRCAPDDVDDLVSDVLLVLWRRLDDVPADAVLAWTYGIAHKCLANHRRSAGRVVSLVQRLARERVAEPMPGGVQDPALDAALRALPPADQELVRLSAWEQLPPRDIAVALGITPNAASIRLHRLRTRLAATLGKDPQRAGHRTGERAKEGPA